MATAADYGLDAGTVSTAPAPALREDMVQNAVAFLTHAKVATSPDASKREFLEKKGLTSAEIDEAFRRAPVAPMVAAEAQVAPTSTLPPPPKPYPVAPGTALAYPPPPPPRQPWTLTHVVLGLAAATAAAAGVHTVVRPRVTAWLADRAATRQAAAAADRDATAKATAAAVADAVGGVLAGHASRMTAAADAVAAAVARLDKGKAPALVNGMVDAAASGITRADLQAELAALGDLLTAGGVVAPPAPPPPPPPPPQPLSQPALSADAQRQIADLRAELAALRTARGAEPVGRWSAQGDSGVGGGVPPPPPPPPPAPSVAPPPVSYTAVLAMLERGETPPGVRTDIVDTPPTGVALPPPAPSGPPPPKPWDAGGGGMAAAPALFGGAAGVASHPLRASAFGSASVDGEPPATANGGAAAVPAPAPTSTTTGDDDDASDVEPIVGVFGGGGVGAAGFGWQPPAPPARSLPG